VPNRRASSPPRAVGTTTVQAAQLLRLGADGMFIPESPHPV
jgi:hypothetical protein